MDPVHCTYGDLGDPDVRDDGCLEVFGRLSSYSDSAGCFGFCQWPDRPALDRSHHVRLQQKRPRDCPSLGDHLPATSAAAGHFGCDARPFGRVDRPGLATPFLQPLVKPVHRGPARSSTAVSGPLCFLLK